MNRFCCHAMTFTLICSLSTLSACTTIQFPGVHRVTIQQGNVISQQMVDRLKPGMTRSQVRFVLGNPVVDDPLDADRWDYVSTFGLSGGEISQFRLIVLFRNDRLARIEGDFKPDADQPLGPSSQVVTDARN